MRFESDEATKAWYNDYAWSVGFSICVGRQERSQRTKKIISRQFLCFREGSCEKRFIDRKDRIRPERPRTRFGCKAMIMVEKRGPNKWILIRFEKTHTHELESPDKVPFLRSHVHISNIPKRHTGTAQIACTNSLKSCKDCDAEFELSYDKAIVKTQLAIEEQLAELYTRPVFLKFQEELCASLRYIAIKTKEDGDLSTYRVTKFGDDTRSYTVSFNTSKMRANCTCLMFEFVRILCRHELIVFRLLNILMLPSHYIMEPYMRNVKIRVEYVQHDIIGQADCANFVSLR
ncbi:hypothetical protein MRB53_035818 [Persea americana]|uniref:Uncharacterized protein n=1 Tax=Persea americana TaxID=3435 RepID=A0ACC2K5Z7_PERAE|nr:hypothetical protein MRB53_035818 [Persea americana]